MFSCNGGRGFSFQRGRVSCAEKRIAPCVAARSIRFLSTEGDSHAVPQRKLRWMMAGALTLTAPLAGAAVISYSTSLSGAAEAPPNASAGVGSPW
jgi:hypothetical protein